MIVTLIDDPQTIVGSLKSVWLRPGSVELEDRIGNFVRHQDSRLLEVLSSCSGSVA
jgi:hypothetical protein